MDVAWAPAVPPGHTYFSWDLDQFETQEQLQGYAAQRPASSAVKIHTSADNKPSAAVKSSQAPSKGAAQPSSQAPKTSQTAKTSQDHSSSSSSSSSQSSSSSKGKPSSSTTETKESKIAPSGDTAAVRKQIADAIRGWNKTDEKKSGLDLTSGLTVIENGMLKWNREEKRNLEDIPAEQLDLLTQEVEQCIATRSAGVSQGLHDKYMQYVMNKPEGARKHGQIGAGHSLYVHALSLLHGIGTPIDKKNAVLFLHQAAEEGVAEAISLLGYCYELGDGVREDPKRAVQCYEAALKLGDPHAAVRLGRCLWEGIPKVLPTDRARAPQLIEDGLAELRIRVARNQDGLPGVSRALMLLHTQMNLV